MAGESTRSGKDEMFNSSARGYAKRGAFFLIPPGIRHAARTRVIYGRCRPRNNPRQRIIAPFRAPFESATDTFWLSSLSEWNKKKKNSREEDPSHASRNWDAASQKKKKKFIYCLPRIMIKNKIIIIILRLISISVHDFRSSRGGKAGDTFFFFFMLLNLFLFHSRFTRRFTVFVTWWRERAIRRQLLSPDARAATSQSNESINYSKKIGTAKVLCPIK